MIPLLFRIVDVLRLQCIYIYFFFVKHPQQFSAAQKNHLISSIYVWIKTNYSVLCKGLIHW